MQKEENISTFSSPSMCRIKLPAACKIMDMDIRVFKDWCEENGVTVHHGKGGSFVLADDLKLGCKRQVEPEMKKKLGPDWESILLDHREPRKISSGFLERTINSNKEEKKQLSAEAEKFNQYVKSKTKQIFKTSY